MTTETPAPAAPESLAERVQKHLDNELGRGELIVPDAPATPEPSPPEGADAEPEAPAEPEAASPDTVEVEINGKVYQIPAEIKDGYLAQADYTRNVQQLAKQRETVAEREQAAQQALAAFQVAGPVIAEFHNTQGYLQQLSQIDIATLRQTNPDQANHLEIEAVKAQQRLQQLAGQISAIPQVLREMDDKAVRDEATRNLPEALKLVPDLPKRQQEFAQAGAKYGFTSAELGRITDPRLIACLRDLAEFQKLTANRDQIKEKVANAPPLTRPGARTANAASATKDYNSALRNLRTDRSNDAFVAALKAQRQAQGKG